MDRYYGCITIGGLLPRDLLDAFLYVTGVSPADFDSHRRIDTEKERDAAWSEQDQIVVFDYLAPLGRFTELEQWCRIHNLPYVRESPPAYEHPGETSQWQPGMRESETYEPMIPIEKVRELHQLWLDCEVAAARELGHALIPTPILLPALVLT